MGFAACAGAFSALAAKGTAGMCCHIRAVGLSLLSHASQVPKPCWQESVGERELGAVPFHSQPAVKWFLRDKWEETAGQCWVPVAPAAALGLGMLCPFRVRGDITAIKPLALRSDVAAHRVLLHQLHKQSKLSESALKTPGSVLPSQPTTVQTPGFFLEQSGLGKFAPSLLLTIFVCRGMPACPTAVGQILNGKP